MKNRSTNIFLILMLFMIFSTSSMDLFLNFQIMGFSLRLSNILMMLAIALFFLSLTKYKELFLSKPEIILWIWSIFLFLFSVNSLNIIRGIGYGIWGLVFALWCIAISNWFRRMDEITVEKVIFLYILSFFPSIILGFLQWLIPSFTFSRYFWLKSQETLQLNNIYSLHRINGFNYEPSYYVTYLITLPPILWAWIKTHSSTEKVMGIISLIVVSAIIILSTSRMGWIALLVFYAIIAIVEVILWCKTHLSKKSFLILTGFFITASIFLLTIFLLSLYSKKLWTELISFLGGSFYHRLYGNISAIVVFFTNPIKPVGMGGIAPWIAFQEKGLLARNNFEAKQFEANNIIFEIISGGGILGSVLFTAFWLSIMFLFFKKLKTANKTHKFYLTGFMLGCILQWFLLLMNQNIFRIYVWVHISLVLALLLIKLEETDSHYDVFIAKTSKIITSTLLSVLVIFAGGIAFVFQSPNLKIHKIEIPLIKSSFNGRTKILFECFNLVKDRDETTNIIIEFTSKKYPLFTEEEKEMLYEYVREKLIPLNVRLEAFHFATNFISLIKKYNNGTLNFSTDEVISIFNCIISNENLYSSDLVDIKKIKLSPLTRQLLSKNSNINENEKIKLNRLFIEDVFADYEVPIPKDITKDNISNILITLKHNKTPAFLTFGKIIFYTDKGTIVLNPRDFINYFEINNAPFKFKGNLITIYFENEREVDINFNYMYLSLFLKYIKNRVVHFSTTLLLAIIVFLISLFIKQ